MKKKKERRTYLPRVLGSGQVMMPADLKRLHKYMLEIEHISVIQTRCAQSSKRNGPSLHTSCRHGRSINLDLFPDLPCPLSGKPDIEPTWPGRV
jgi:hypothetical protein